MRQGAPAETSDIYRNAAVNHSADQRSIQTKLRRADRCIKNTLLSRGHRPQLRAHLTVFRCHNTLASVLTMIQLLSDTLMFRGWTQTAVYVNWAGNVLQAAAIVADESMNHDLTDDPISSLPQRRYDFVKSAADKPASRRAESALVCICKVLRARVPSAVCFTQRCCNLWWAAGGTPKATCHTRRCHRAWVFVLPRAARRTHHGREERKVMQWWWILPPWRKGNLHSLPRVVKTVPNKS